MRNGRLRILTLVSYYLPGYKGGGQLRTIANMVEQLADDFEFLVVTGDRDVRDKVPYADVEVDAWNTLGKAAVYYCSPSSRSIGSFARLLTQTRYDVLYLNSFFDPIFTVRPLIARRLGLADRGPCVIAPRGEFSPGALAIKAWKKDAYLGVARASGLYSALTWQASSPLEAEHIGRALGRTARDVVVAPDLPPAITIPSIRCEAPKGEARLRLVFMSRLTPKKNLDFALRVLARITISTQLDIFGPVEDEGYWRECAKLISALPRNVAVEYRGTIPPQDVVCTLGRYDIFLFPTRGENFGHVILESLAAGTPVVLSDQTPWREDAEGACTVIPLSDEAGYRRALEGFAKLDSGKRAARRNAARRIAQAYLQDADVVACNRRLFRAAAANAT